MNESQVFPTRYLIWYRSESHKAIRFLVSKVVAGPQGKALFQWSYDVEDAWLIPDQKTALGQLVVCSVASYRNCVLREVRSPDDLKKFVPHMEKVS